MAINRRIFLGAAGLAVAGGTTKARAGASERVRVAVIGVRSRGKELAAEFARQNDAEVVAVCDIDDADLRQAGQGRRGVGGQGPADREGLPPAARRQGDRRRRRRHARPLARPARRHGLPGRQGRLHREAGQPQRRRGPADGRGRAEVQARRPARHPAAEHAARPGGDRVTSSRARSARSGMARAWIHQKRQADRPRQARAGARRRRLRHVAGPRPRPAVHEQPLPLQLALVLELGHRRDRQQRHPRPRRRPLGPGRRRPARASPPAAASTSSTTTRKSPTPRSSPGSSPTPASSGSTGCGRSTTREGSGFGIAFYGDKGTVLLDEARAGTSRTAARRAASRPSGQAAPHPELPRLHQDREDPNADIEIGHLSTRLCHLGNIAHRVGRKLTFDAATETFPGDLEANKLLGREYSSRFEMPSQV